MTVAEVVFSTSKRTTALVAVVTAILGICVAFSLVPGVAGDAFWGNVPFAIVSGGLAALVLHLALTLPAGTRVRRQAILLSVGVLSYAVGDIVWLVYELGLDVSAPYPGAPDVFYGPLFYLPMSLALWSAVLNMRRLDRSLIPFATGAAVSVLAFAFLWVTTIAGALKAPYASTSGKLVAVAYPAADCFALLLPVVALCVMFMRLGGTQLSRPWWNIAAAAFIMAGADAIYVSLQAHGAYVTGLWLDVVWLLAFALIAIGASRLVDVHRLGA